MKKTVKPLLNEGEVLSTNDLIASLCWMLHCELKTSALNPSTGGDMNIDNSMILMTAELLRNGYSVIPENYCGNAYMLLPIVASLGEDHQASSLKDVFLSLARKIRSSLNALRQSPEIAAECLMQYYQNAREDTLS